MAEPEPIPEVVTAWFPPDLNAETRAVVAHRRLVLISETTERLLDERRTAIRELLADGWTQTEVGDLLDLSRSRISHLVKEARPEDPN
jgi:DNA-directed RNA polymerase specialized sigma24 family protein